jgi:hypothetical protein
MSCTSVREFPNASSWTTWKLIEVPFAYSPFHWPASGRATLALAAIASMSAAENATTETLLKNPMA